MSVAVETASRYRAVAAELRRLAEQIKYDYRRQDQIRALADGFERYAARFDLEALSQPDGLLKG